MNNNLKEFNKDLALDLLNSEKEFPVDLDDAWKWLGYYDKSTAKRAFLNAGFVENLDYCIKHTHSTGISKVPKENVLMSFQSFKSFVLLSKKKNSAYILNIISEIDSGNIQAVVRTRLEIDFKELLFACVSWKTLVISQFYCVYGTKKYFIDFYVPEFNLAIEYDEKYHNSQQPKDILRQKTIQTLLNCIFIRVKQGEEMLAISQICQKIFS